MKLVRRHFLSVLVVAAAISASPLQSAAAGDQISKFLGHFIGQTIVETHVDVSLRDLDVKISRSKGGFTLDWTTLTHRADGRVKETEATVRFVSAGRPGVYRSANRVDLLGKAVPLDPVLGEPYIWASLAGETLTVYRLIVVADGGYELQSYARSLVADGMELLYTRVRNGKVSREIRAKLTRRID